MTRNERLYIRPGKGLSREEGKRQMVNAYLEFFATQLEAGGDHEKAAQFRAAIAKNKAAARAAKKARKSQGNQG